MFITKVFAADDVTSQSVYQSLRDAFSFIPGGGLDNILNFGVIIGSTIALFTIIYAGVIYSMAGDDSSKQKEARNWIWAAVKGLAIILLGYVLLRFINPNIFTV